MNVPCSETCQTQKSASPQVGIFWIYKSRIFHAETVAVEDGTRYGDAIGGNADHADTWEKLRTCGKLSKLPENLSDEYFSIPRGRVVFHTDTGRYTILHGSLTARQIETVRKYFCLPEDLCDAETDLHYGKNV